MTKSRLARRLGLDGNPLRRRTDKIAACLGALLVAVFLIGAPWLSAAAVGWAGRTGAVGHRGERSWRQAPTVLQHAGPVPATWILLDRSWVQARRSGAGGHPGPGETAARGGLAAENEALLRVDAAVRPASRRSHAPPVLAREAGAAVIAAVTLGVVLLCLAQAAVGPQWAKRFRARG
jgi:hypothetical protein